MNFKEQYEEIADVARTIIDNPERGYKEFKTNKTGADFLKKGNPDIELQSFSTTGLRTTLGSGKPLNIAFIAELDAVYAPTHWRSD
ncbi:carboxypeptidase, partial [Clostridium perfringens]